MTTEITAKTTNIVNNEGNMNGVVEGGKKRVIEDESEEDEGEEKLEVGNDDKISEMDMMMSDEADDDISIGMNNIDKQDDKTNDNNDKSHDKIKDKETDKQETKEGKINGHRKNLLTVYMEILKKYPE